MPVDPSVYAGWVTALITAGCWFIDHRRRRRAEAELVRRDSTALFPYFVLSTTYRSMIMLPELGHFLSNRMQNVLQIGRDEVGDLPAGESVILMIDNLNRGCLRAEVDFDGKPAEFGAEPNLPDASGGLWLAYPFDPVQRGKAGRFRMKMLSRAGTEQTHIYETIHGQRVLHRIEPP